MITDLYPKFLLFQRSASPSVTLKLKKPKSDKKVKWSKETVDNENMNKKKSKCKKTTGHLKSICISCCHYFLKTGGPSHNFSIVKDFQKCNPPDFKFYLGK